jgi:ferric-dicitrate binding protein FerR (iron transport regulator)
MRTVKTLPRQFIRSALIRQVIALLVLAALLDLVMVVASPKIRVQPPPALIRTGGIVTVNSARANPGQTIFSGSTIATARQSWSTISLDNRARIELNEATVFSLEFSRSDLRGSLSDGEVYGLVPSGLRAEIRTADASVVSNPAQNATFVLRVEACNTKVSVQTGQLEVRSGNRVQSVGAGESFSTADRFPTAPQQNLSQRKRIGLLVGIGATLGVLLIALIGHRQKVPDDRPGSVCAPSGDSRC